VEEREFYEFDFITEGVKQKFIWCRRSSEYCDWQKIVKVKSVPNLGSAQDGLLFHRIHSTDVPFFNRTP